MLTKGRGQGGSNNELISSWFLDKSTDLELRIEASAMVNSAMYFTKHRFLILIFNE